MKRRRRKYLNEPRPDFGRGAFTGLTSYRYGAKKPVSLAGGVAPRVEPILKKKERQSLIDQVVEVAKDWRSSPWEREAAIRTGLRVGFVLEGHGWLRSDLQAGAIVEEALRIAAPERPSWEEGQRGHAAESSYCHWCYVAIPEEDQSRGRRFCSTHCAKVALERSARKTNHHYGAVLRSAIRLIDKSKAPPQTCIYCEKSFQADRKQRFCSISCKSRHQLGDHVIHPRPCGMCGTIYKPWTHEQRYCSKPCGRRAAQKAEAESLAGVRRECPCCGTSFQPATRHAKFCSSACSHRAGSRAYKERNRPPTPPPALCAWCGEEYQPKIALRKGASGSCSTRCNSDRSRFGKGDRPRDLTRRVFDHFIALPVDEFRRRVLTPEKFDWMAMEMGRAITGEAAFPAPCITDSLFTGS